MEGRFRQQSFGFDSFATPMVMSPLDDGVFNFDVVDIGSQSGSSVGSVPFSVSSSLGAEELAPKKSAAAKKAEEKKLILGFDAKVDWGALEGFGGLGRSFRLAKD